MRRIRLTPTLVGALCLGAAWGCGSSSDDGVAMSPDVQASPAAGAGGVATMGSTASSTAQIMEGAETGALASRGAGTAETAGSGGAGAVPMDDTACTIRSTLTMSAAISTVGIIEFTTDLPGVDAAHIDFGLDESYGMRAPVDLAEPSYRTLLLGMKADYPYHYRVVAMAGNQVCRGPDNTLMTGSVPQNLGLLDITVDTPYPEAAAKGFLLASFFMNGPTFILDADGDYVWWADAATTRARMSYDGKYMWTQSLNWDRAGVIGAGGASPGGNPVIHRISMDGMDVQTHGLADWGDPTHDFDVTPDGSYISPQFDSTGCMKIVERTADGQMHDIVNAATVNPGTLVCLVNSIHYWPADDSITYSDLPNNTYVKMSRSGQVEWVLGGANSMFTQGDAVVWHGEHGHQLLAPDRFLMFANGANPFGGARDGTSSIVYEVALDPATNTATRVWSYDSGLQTTVFGDAQRLPNGNTIVNYGTKDTIHEVDPDGTLVRSMTWPAGNTISYIEWRTSLYGPPDR